MRTNQSSSLASTIALDTGSLLASSLWSRVLGMVVNIVTARVLGPADFGVLKLIGFVPKLAKFGSFGFGGVAQREIPHLRGAGASSDEEQRVKSVSFTADLIWTCLLALAVIVVSLFYERPEVRYGLWISALALVAGQIGRIYAVVCSVDKRFAVIAQAAAIGTTVEALTVLTTVYWGRMYSVLGGALLGGLVAIVWYHRCARLNFRWLLARDELVRQFVIALPLAGGTVAFGLFAWVERLQVLSLFGSEQLGIYMLTVAVYELGLLLTNTMLRASGVHLYERLGQGSDARNSAGLVLKPSLVLAYLFPLGGGLLWLLGPLLVSIVLPAYVDVAPLLPWVGVMLTLGGVSAMPMTAMNSARLNMQTLTMLMWLGASGLFAGITYFGARLGWGIEGAAVAKAVVFAAMALVAYALTYSFFFPSLRGLVAYVLRVSCPLLMSTAMVWGLNVAWPATSWESALLKAVLFVASYIPLLYSLQRQTRIFDLVGRPLLATVSPRVSQRLSRLW